MPCRYRSVIVALNTIEAKIFKASLPILAISLYLNHEIALVSIL